MNTIVITPTPIKDFNILGIDLKPLFYEKIHTAFTKPEEILMLSREEILSIKSHYHPEDVIKVTELRDHLLTKVGEKFTHEKDVFLALHGLIHSTNRKLESIALWFKKTFIHIWNNFDEAQHFIVRFFATITQIQQLHIAKNAKIAKNISY